MSDCKAMRSELGAYVLGALAPEEEEAVARHLEACKRCRTEAAELGFASSLLRTPAARRLDDEAAPPSAERALALVGEARQRERRRLRRARAAGLGGGAAFLAAVLLAAGLATRPVDRFSPKGQPVVLAPAPGVAAAATVALSARPWGTQVDLVADRLPALAAGERFAVWIVRADGVRVAAGTFRPRPGTRATVRLAAAVPLPEVVRVGVTREGTRGGAPVLGAPAPRAGRDPSS